ncbi:MAG: hypothetical protein HGA22_12195 [Clostridiales bacterium]|nr:hypothetical protein [Clostridiales bacterium]
MLKIKAYKRSLSLILPVLMILSLFTVTIFAADTPPAIPGTDSSAATTTDTTGTTVTTSSSSTLAESSSSAYFKDLGATTSWANSYIDNLYTQGIVKGTADGTYSPNSSIKRCDLALMLYRRYAFATEGFSYGDVPTDAYYYQAVMRGKASKVFESTTYFYPDRAVTREEAAVWMYNCEVYKGMPTDFSTSDVSSYNDASSVSKDAVTAVSTLTALGVFKGDNTGNFNPASNMTRAEMAVAFYRLTTLGGGASGSTAGSTTGGTASGGSTATIDHGTYANKADADATDAVYSSTGDGENALRIEDAKTVTLKNITVNKTAGAAGSGDTSNFYGVNAGILALDGANVTIDKASVTTTATGSNGIFSYGEGTKVTVGNSTIRTSRDSSGGIMVTGGGTMYVNDCDIETQGGSSAALRTDRGGGTLVVDGGTYVSNGNGSPAIYCTAAITVSNATLTAKTSEAIVVEGKNSVALKDCIVTGKMIKDNVENLQNVMIYQSMSGDASTGTSSFTMEGGSLTAGNGDMIYITNTSSIVKLTDVDLKLYNDVLLKVVGNDARNGWGVVGSNGGQCVFTASSQTMTGNIIVDKISALELSLTSGSAFTGAINTANSGGSISVNLDATSSWTLTADSYLSALTGSTDRIVTKGFKVYVDGTAVK